MTNPETTQLASRTDWIESRQNYARQLYAHPAQEDFPDIDALMPASSYDYKRPEFATYDVLSYLHSLSPAEVQEVSHLSQLGEELGELALQGEIEISPANAKKFSNSVMRFLSARSEDVSDASEKIFTLFRASCGILAKKIDENSALLPSGLIARLEQARVTTGIRAGDIVVMGGNDVDYSASEDIITIGHEAGEDQSIEMIVHELLHKISGGTYERISNEKRTRTETKRTRSGFSEDVGIYVPRRYERLDEAMTQHLTEGLLYGDLQTVSPQARREKDGIAQVSPVYETFREVLSEFIEQSEGKVTIQHFIDAYFEDNDGSPQTDARKELAAVMRASYGPGALRKLNDLCKIATTDGLDTVKRVITNIKAAAHSHELSPN